MAAETATDTFAVRYDYVPDMDNRRAPHRADHLGFLSGLHEAGSLVLAGALTDPVDTAWLVVRAESQPAARAMTAEDPYVHHGLVRSVTVRHISVAIPSG